MSYRNLTSHALNSRLKDVWEDMRLGRHIAQAAAGFGALTPLMALANPAGGQVVAGAASITTPNANRMVIDQSSQNAVINWQQFSVGAHQYVQFVQPNSSAVVLNRVISNDPSRIFGNISANGQVFLVNPNGVFFAPGSSLDAAGILVSTLDIKNNDFMQGNYVFAKGSDAPDAVIINQGSMSATRNGYVVLSGDYVENDGRIQAQTGRVYLAAGANATLTFDSHNLISYTVDGATLARLAGAVNAGDIVATGGTVVMTGDVANALTATAVNNQGFIAAKSIKDHGGTIVLEATGGELINSGTLMANAAASAPNMGGGTIILRGDDHTQLTSTSRIDAAGDGTGTGGFIELSGHTLGVKGAATAGKGGEILLDPSKINIISGPSSAGQTTGINSVGTGFIANALNANNNVTIVASGSIDNLGGATRAITATGTGNLTLEIGTGAAGCAKGVCVGTPPSFSPNSGTINLTGLTINVKGVVSVQASHGSVTVDNITANKGIDLRGNHVQINGNLTAVSSSVNIGAAPGASQGGFIKVAPGKTLNAKRVNLGISGSYGGLISIGAVTATSSTTLHEDSTNPLGLNTIKTGVITAPRMNLTQSGQHDVITTGALTAVDAAGSASININQSVTNPGTGQITVNGNITVSGKPNSSNARIGRYDLPQAATLILENTGSNGGVHSIKVNGSINVTAAPGTYAVTTSDNESGPVSGRHQVGTGIGGGVASVFIVAGTPAGSASVTGPITATGPDAFAVVQGHSVSLGNITVTGTGHQVSRNLATRSSRASFTGQSYTSNNNAGQAAIIVGDAGFASYGGPTGVLKVGNVSASGKGVAEALLFGSQVTTGNITVSATAAKGTTHQHGNIGGCSFSTHCSNLNSSGFYRGIADSALKAGTVNLGRADIIIASNEGGHGGTGSGVQGVSIKTGTLSATGVGQAFISLSAKTIQTQGLTVAATKGTEKGSGSSQSGTTAVTLYTHTFNINGGEAGIKIRSGNSASGSSGVLTQGGGPVTINGAISATGPGANVDIKGKTITVGGAVTIAGSGGTVTSATKVTGPNGGFSTSFNGPGKPTSLNLQGAASGSVNVAGKINVKGPGLVGAIVIGGGVTLHGLSGSASAVKTYVTKDTRVSTSKTTFTGASLAVFVDDVTAVGGKLGFTSAADTGDVTLRSKGNVDLATRVNINGNLNVQAVGSIFGTSNGVVAHFNAVQNQVTVGNRSSGGGPSPGFLPTASFKANAMAFVAGKSISMSGTQLTIGNGSISSIHGDAELLLGLTVAGIAPAASNPNGAFIAGGSVSLGGLKLTGSYLLLQGTAVSILGPVSVPAGTLVQVVPFDTTGPIDIEDAPAASSVLTLAATSSGFFLNNQGFISLFAGDTVAVGNADETGNVTLGANGPIDIGDTNLIIDTTGTITGLSTVTSTGIVSSLISILGPPVVPPTAGEIDPNSGNTTPPNKKNGNGSLDTGTGGGTGGTITQDTGTASVCH